MKLRLLSAWLLALGLSATLPAAPRLQARVHIFHPACSHSRPVDVARALSQASQVLERRCGISLSLTASTNLKVGTPWCRLPAGPAERSRLLQALAAQAKHEDPRCLAFFLLPSAADQRLSWAVVDVSEPQGCGAPREPRFLARFGSAFFTDQAFLGDDPKAATGASAIVMAHEALHCLTQRSHPTGEPRGSLMADHLTDMGQDLDEDWCACARQSPYLEPRP